MRGLSFRIGAALYALPLRDIQQMLALPRLRPLAGAAPCVAGLLNLHGQGLAVIDLGRACGAQAIEAHRQSRIALLPAQAGERQPLGVLLHAVAGIVEAALPLAACPVETTPLPIFSGISLHQGESLLWIDAAALRAWVPTQWLAPPVETHDHTFTHA